jgi:hypothetical protein
MSQVPADKSSTISADMTLLDIISQHRQTEAVFRQYDEKAGVCLCCEALFDPLRNVAEKYRLDLKELMSNIEAVIK